MRWDATLAEELVERIWNEPTALFAEGVRLQEKPRCSVARIEGADGSFVWKRHNWGDIERTLRKAISRPVAKKCWLDGRFLHEAGVPTPRPRLYLERRVGPVNTSSYLLSDYVAGTSLYRYMRYQQPSEEMIRHLARQVAAIWQQLDDLHIQHNDFKTENFIVDPQGKLWLIDLERLRRYRRAAEVRRKQVRDIEDLLHPRNWRANPEAAELFRRELLQTPAAAAALASVHGAAHPLRRPLQGTNRASQLVTVLIPCRNAAGTILACLESVRDMADEILVADAGSTDETLSLVRRFGGCRIVQRRVSDPAVFEAWACQQARHSWILRVLPHEQVNSELGREVQDVLASSPEEEGFSVVRSRYFRGFPVNHGGNPVDESLRLFRKDAVRFESRGGDVQAAVHADRVRRMRYALTHETCPDVPQHLGHMLRAAADAAEEHHAQGTRPQLRSVLWRAPWSFFKSYVVQGGWLDGWAGLHESVLAALTVYLRELLLWDRHQPAASSADVGTSGCLRIVSDSASEASAEVELRSLNSADEDAARGEGGRMRPAA